MNWQRYTLTADTAPSITLTKTPLARGPDGLARVCRVTEGWAGSNARVGVRTEECLPHLTSSGLWGGL